MPTDARRTPWSVIYHDGCGNGMRVWRETREQPARFEYDPITPEESSTGTYSGGEPSSGEVNDDVAAELWGWLNELESNPSLHTDLRMKMTGDFAVRTPERERAFIVKNTPPLREFDGFVARLRGQ